jgi:hypothetical protein
MNTDKLVLVIGFLLDIAAVRTGMALFGVWPL